MEEKIINKILSFFRIISHTILLVPSIILWLGLLPFNIGFIIYFYLKKEITKFRWKNIFFPFTCWYYGVFKQDNYDFFFFDKWDF